MRLSRMTAPSTSSATTLSEPICSDGARRWPMSFGSEHGPSSMSAVQEASLAIESSALEDQLEEHRKALTGYCYRMLGSPFEAEDAVQETLLRAWRGFERFEGRAALRSWLYRIATNVCIDTLKGRERRALPMDFGPAQEPLESNLHTRPEVTWIQPIPESTL